MSSTYTSRLHQLINGLRQNGPSKTTQSDLSHNVSNRHTVSTNSSKLLLTEPEVIVLEPVPAATRDRHTSSLHSSRPSLAELDSLQWGKPLDGPSRSTSPTPRQLEQDRHDGTFGSSLEHSSTNVVGVLPSVKENRLRAAVCLLAFFTQGLNDSAVGALLPYMERYYHASYAVISLIFIANALGFITAGPICHILNNKFGRAIVLSASAALNVVAAILLVIQPPFAVVVIAFYLLGFGFATILSLDNVFIVNLQGGTVLLGFMHGWYGIGGVVAPFAATAMVNSGIRWSFFYFILMALSIINCITFYWSFQGYETEPSTIQLMATLEQRLTRQSTRDAKKSILKKAFRNRTTLLGGLLIFAYQGAEVSISGWVISFLIDYRNGNPAQVGFVTSGFWGGITAGRFILVGPAHAIGDKISVIILVALTAAFQFVLWFVPDVIGNAVAVALIGFLLGPIYPCAAGVFAKLLPSDLQITSLGLISGVGSSGGALAPFFTGLLAQRLGTIVLNPVCIVLYVAMQVAWISLPKVAKRTE